MSPAGSLAPRRSAREAREGTRPGEQPPRRHPPRRIPSVSAGSVLMGIKPTLAPNGGDARVLTRPLSSLAVAALDYMAARWGRASRDGRAVNRAGKRALQRTALSAATCLLANGWSPARLGSRCLICPEFSGQRICGYFTLRTAVPSIPRGLAAVSGTEARSACALSCTRIRCTSQCPGARARGLDTGYGEHARSLARRRTIRPSRYGQQIPVRPADCRRLCFFSVAANCRDV